MSSSEGEIFELLEYPKTKTEAVNVNEDVTYAETNSNYSYDKISSVSKLNEKIYRTKFRQRFHVKKTQARRNRSTLEKYSGGLEVLKRLTQTIQKEDETIRTDFKDYETKIKTNIRSDSGLIDQFYFFTSEGLENDKEITDKPVEHDKNLVQFWPQSLNCSVELKETKYFWKPSRSAPPLFAKIGTNSPRFLSEEGIYVESFPSVTKSHKYILEQRLITENDKKWFNCEGDLKITKTPLESALLRPSTSNPTSQAKKILVEYVNAQFVQPEFEELKINKENVLQINVRYLKFQHHPLFSAQHVLQNRLICYYTIFKQEKYENKIYRITKQLNYLRNTKKNLENYLVDVSNDEFQNALQKMYKTLKEIRKLREKLFDENINYRKTIKSILETWKMLKHVRKFDGYVSTPLKLIIKKEKRNYVQDKRDINNEIKQLFYEIKYESDFIKRNRNVFTMNDFDIVDDENFSFNSIKTEYGKCFREPGEPVIDFFVEYNQEMITKVVKHKNENTRRNVVKDTKIYFKLVHKGTELCKSKTVQLDDNFFCQFDEKFIIKMDKETRPVTVQVFEQNNNNISKKKLYEMNLTLPRLSTCKKTKICLENAQQVPQKYGGVGSGESVNKFFFEKYNFNLVNLKSSTSAVMSYDVESTLNICYNSNTDIDIEKLFHVFDDTTNENDPQDPKYSKFENLLIANRDEITEAPSDIYYEKHTKPFQYNFHLRPLMFCEHDEIKTNNRLTMLKLRDKNVPQFYGLSVPINEKEIPEHLLSDYEKRTSQEDAYKLVVAKEYITKPEGLAILRQIYFHIFQIRRNSDMNLSYDDVVNEQLLRQFENYTRQTINCTFNWLTLHSCLNLIPYKKNTNYQETSFKKEPFFEIKTPLKIFVTVRSGLNLPKRTRKNVAYDEANERTENNTDDFSLRLRVILKYTNKIVESKIIKSSNPVWNETLTLEIDTLNIDFMSPNFLSGTISLHLFDVVSSEQKIWLGSTEINISSVYESDILEGVFRLETPTLLFGYEPENTKNLSSYFTNAIGVSLSIRAQPFMPRLQTGLEILESNETPRLKSYILKWNERYNENFPHRRFSALAIDIYGRTSCVTRYITPIEPPPLNRDGFQVTPEQLAKYFSKFSFTSYNKFYQNIWLTASQFLNITVGSVVDHAVILVCCLESLDLQVWLLLGYGIPNGSSAYVLTRESPPNLCTPKYYIFDVTTGIKYNITDNTSPLQRIYCVVNRENVWANIQRTDRVENMRFDLSKTADWLPLFTDEISGPSISIQQRITYRMVPNECYLTENKLEKKIHRRIAKLKTIETIQCNIVLSKAFKKLMATLSNYRFSDQLDYDVVQDLLNIRSSTKQKMKGFLMCKTYNSSSSLFEFIENTDLLKPLRTHAKSEYILATQINVV